MKPCEVCGKSHHLHTENDLSNCLVWANDENRKLKAEAERHRYTVDVFRRHFEENTANAERARVTILNLKAEVERLRSFSEDAMVAMDFAQAVLSGSNVIDVDEALCLLHESMDINPTKLESINSEVPSCNNCAVRGEACKYCCNGSRYEKDRGE